MLLSYSEPDLIVGSYLADFLKNNQLSDYSSSIRKGVLLHRKIDSFTDSHHSVSKCTKILHPTQHKYAPVVVDIYFDYFLTKNWKIFHTQALEIFTSEIYNVLLDQMNIYPGRVQQILPRMVEDDFLMSCSNEERLIRTFSFLKLRANFHNNFEYAHLDLKLYYDLFEENFLIFFPDVIAFVQKDCFK